MSELAFNLNGEPFEVPDAAVAWRVRRLKRRGAPEVLYGREGTPLVVPIDVDMDDLRREVRSEGRYRLDPVDDRNRTISDAPAGYVCIYASEPTVVPAPLTRPAVPAADHVLLEAMRMNTELARTIVDKFPLMLDSVAALVRAAGDAGMTTRPPRALPEPREEEDDDNDEPETEDSAPKATGWIALLQTLAPMIGPVISAAFASGKLQIPGGVGTLFDCRRASPHASAAGTGMASTPDVEPMPEPHDSVPARSGGSASYEPTVSPGQASTPRAAETGVLATPISTPGAGQASPSAPELATTDAPATEASPELPTLDAPATEQSPELPTVDSAAQVHFGAIQRALTSRESMLVRALAAELSPAELRAWFSELQRLSVPAAVAKVRAVLGPEADNTESRARVGPDTDDTEGGGGT